MPEMKGRSLEELDELFVNKVSVKNFPKYQCTVLEEALHDVQTHTGMLKGKDGAAEHAEQVP